MREIGERLQARARELGLSDAEVARRLGLAQGRYSNYTNGVREPDFATFARICRALGMTPNDALGFGAASIGGATATRRRLDSLLDSFDADRLELSLLLLDALRIHGTQAQPADTDRLEES